MKFSSQGMLTAEREPTENMTISLTPFRELAVYIRVPVSQHPAMTSENNKPIPPHRRSVNESAGRKKH